MRTECELDSQGNELIEGRDMAIGTQRSLHNTNDNDDVKSQTLVVEPTMQSVKYFKETDSCIETSIVEHSPVITAAKKPKNT